MSKRRIRRANFFDISNDMSGGEFFNSYSGRTAVTRNGFVRLVRGLSTG